MARTVPFHPVLAAAILAAALPGCTRRAPGPPPPTEGPGAPGAMVRLAGGMYRAGAGRGPMFETTYETVRPFLIDATEVTVAAYAACVAAGACRPASATVEWERISDKERAAASAHCNADRADRADHPVNCVDWEQAKAYCAWAGKRLPGEDEWEWTARNGKRGTPFPWGEDEPADRACWNGPGSGAEGGKRAGTCPVGSHPSGDSESGVKDLAGNVWEWTATADRILVDGRGRGGVPVKVARGGGWSDVAPRNVSAAVRLLDLPSLRRADLGFRCARKP
jgi:formylglycine-generating enzyme required for sulfatase activity